MRKILALVLSLLWVAPVSAQIVGTLPFTLQNGTIADANQVMSDLNTIVAAVNANSASAGVNNNITALTGLTTPLVYTSGGTSNYIGGTSSGSANAQIIASPIPSGFNLITGKSVTFAAGFTNNGPTQLNVNATGLTNVFRQTASGAVAMVGGELVLGQVYTAVFDGTQFQIQGPSPQSVTLPCTVIDWVGVSAPSGYLLMNGQTPSRTAFATLFSCISVQGVAATTASGSASVVVSNSALFQVGWKAGGNNITCNSVINAIPDGTHITLSANAGASGATTLTIGPYSQGDCSTTFAVGNFLGRSTIARDTSGTVLTAASCANPASVGASCGLETRPIAQGNLPNVNFAVTDPGHLHGFGSGTGATALFLQPAVASGSPTINVVSNTPATVLSASTATAVTGISVNSGGSNTPFIVLHPVATVDKYIKF